MIVDAHLHSAAQIGGGYVREGGRYGMALKPDGAFRMLPPSFDPTACPPEMALHFMDWIGIDHAFLIQGMYYGWLNEERVYACLKWPDRFTGFALVRPDDLASANTLNRLLDAGLGGLGEIEVALFQRLFPGFRLRSEVAWKWWEICSLRDVLVTLHLSDGMADVNDVLWMVEEFSRLRVIIAHLGLPPGEGWKEQVRLGKHPRIFIEMSALPGQFEAEGYPYPSGQGALAWAVAEIGAEKILWGSDFPGILPFCTYRQTLDLVRMHCNFLTESDRQGILGENAARLILRA
jgi:L-galactono-1,5-lactonase